MNVQLYTFAMKGECNNMEQLIIEASQDTPEVVFAPETNTFKIEQRSYPEDAFEFYGPVLKWMQMYAEQPNDNTLFEFKLDYFNTASSKQIFKLLMLLEQASEKSKVKIVWKHKDSDKEMKNHGEIFSSIIDTEFEVISYSS